MRTLFATLVLAATLACGTDVDPPEPTAAALGPDSFRAVLVELSLARVAALPDTQAWRTRRAAILERHGLDGADLREFVEAYGRQDELMEAIYRDLGAALDSVARSRPGAPGAADAFRGGDADPSANGTGADTTGPAGSD